MLSSDASSATNGASSSGFTSLPARGLRANTRISDDIHLVDARFGRGGAGDPWSDSAFLSLSSLVVPNVADWFTCPNEGRSYGSVMPSEVEACYI